jgi:streptogramin lyase
MRVLIFSLLLVFAATASSKPKGKTTTQPALGIRTPGIQIPFTNLKPEAQIPAPAKPDWIFFSTSIFIPGKDGLDKIDPKTNKPIDPVTGIAKPCGGMASGFGSFWVPSCADGSLIRIDSKTFKVTATLPIGVSHARGIVAASSDSVWMLVDDKTTLARIDPDQNAVVAEIRLPAGCESLIFGETALWLACPDENKILRINPATNLVEKRIDVSAQPQALVTGENSVWALCKKDGKVDRVDPKTNKVSKSIELSVPSADGAIAFGEGSVWVTLAGFPITRIDPQSETVAQQFFGEGGGAILTSPGALWLSNRNEGKLVRIDPKLILATLPE